MQLMAANTSFHALGVQKLAAATVSSARTQLCCQNLATVAIRSRNPTQKCRRGLASGSLRLATQQSIGRGNFFTNLTTVQTARRLGTFEAHPTRAGIRKQVKRAVSDFEVSLQSVGAPALQDDISQLAVALPLGLASFQGLYLFGWVASLRGLLPGARGFFAAADLILCSVMFANCVVGMYALEQSRSGVYALPRGQSARKLKAACPGFLDMVFSLAVSFIPFANLFLWFRFASGLKHLPAKAKAAVAANGFIYEMPRFFSLLLLISGGLRIFLQVWLISNVATLFSALHRPFEEARVKNERVLLEVSRAVKVAGKKAHDGKPKEKEISAEERERIDRSRELEEFDMLLARSSCRDDSAFSGKITFEQFPLPVNTATIPVNLSSDIRCSTAPCQS